MSHIDYFFSPISPFTYLADSGLEEIVREHEATVTYKSINVITLFSRTGGTPPAQRHPLRQEYQLQELQRQSKKQRLPITLKPKYFPTNATPSSYAIIAAQAETYLAKLEKAVISGVFGAPFYIVDDGPGFWGQDRLNDLDSHLEGEF